MKIYLEVIEFDTKEVETRWDVTDRGERNIEKIERGLNINLNHDKYFTRIVRTENVLQEIRH